MSKLFEKISSRLGIILEDEQNTSEIEKLQDEVLKLKKEVQSLISKGYKKDSAVIQNAVANAKSIFAKIDALKQAEVRGTDDSTESTDTSWKDPNSSDYDRRVAENALFHTIGPLTDNPKWTREWTSLDAKYSQAPPYFVPGGDAPTWTQNEVVYAYAGDPDMLGRFMRENPRSPEYGGRGGSPLYRVANKIARKYKRPDKHFISDIYQNGLVALTRLMQPGYDQGKSPFISYVSRTIEGAVENGLSGKTRDVITAGADIKRVLATQDVNEISSYLAPIDGKYKTEKSWDKVEGNPYGPYTSQFYASVGNYLSAIQSGDEEQLDAAVGQLMDLADEIGEQNYLLGATTGVGQAMSTPNRNVASVNLTSTDLPAGEEGKGTFGDTLAAPKQETQDQITPEIVNYVLNLAIETDLRNLKSPRYNKMALDLGAKGGKIGGSMPANQFRYLIRAFGPIASDYPGKGTVRDTKKPRDAVGWWQPGTDPEIEPIPGSDAMWKSMWSRKGYPSMATDKGDSYGISTNAIAEEMTKEVMEFEKLGIPTARKVKTKVDKRTGEQVYEAVTPTSVSNALRAAKIKFRILADIEKDKFDLDESVQREPLLEELCKLDECDFALVKETAAYLASLIILKEDKPKSSVKFTPILKENRRISNLEVNQLLNQLGMSEPGILKLLDQLGARMRSGENDHLSNVIKKAVKHIADNFKRGFPADLDLDKISDMVSHVWKNQPNTQYSSGKSLPDDDIPMVGKEIQSRF